MCAPGDLTPYAKNPRKNDDAAVAAVANSIREFGFNQPIVADEKGVIIVGHTRLKAAELLGLDAVPVYVREGLTVAQKRAYRIADNRVGEIALWDDDLLGAELRALPDFDWTDLGFGDGDLAALLTPPGAVGLTDADDVPDPPKAPRTKLGDVWRCGRHVLVCGDSTDEATVAKCLGDAKPHLMVTDPPYGVCLYQTASRCGSEPVREVLGGRSFAELRPTTTATAS